MTAPREKVHWIRSNGFILGLGLAVLSAFIWPEPGAHGGWLQPEFLNNGGIALILFLQGLSLALEKVRSGAGNWRLHAVIQAFTFLVFPAVGLAMHPLTPLLWPSEPEAIRSGFLYLCVLPSTISTSVVLTAVAGGNTAGALFNAAFSNILGVFLTPMLVHILMQETGQSGAIGPLLLKIMLLTLAPFFTGMALRPFARKWIDANKAWVARLSNTVILFIVYSAFCESVSQRIWVTNGWMITGLVFLEVAVLFSFLSGLVYLTCRLLRMNREDLIAAYFCSVKKTLAMGVPLALLIFGARADLSLILLPVMFYHPFQLLANGVLANRWRNESLHG